MSQQIPVASSNASPPPAAQEGATTSGDLRPRELEAEIEHRFRRVVCRDGGRLRQQIVHRRGRLRREVPVAIEHDPPQPQGQAEHRAGAHGLAPNQFGDRLALF